MSSLADLVGHCLNIIHIIYMPIYIFNIHLSNDLTKNLIYVFPYHYHLSFVPLFFLSLPKNDTTTDININVSSSFSWLLSSPLVHRYALFYSSI